MSTLIFPLLVLLQITAVPGISEHNTTKMDPPLTQTMWITMEEETQEMMAVWPDIIRDVTEHIKDVNIPDLEKWVEDVLQYNVAASKKLHSLTLIYAYKSIASNEQQTEDNMRLVRILAWCVEMVLAHLIVTDDIMDQTSFRRGRSCWHRCNNVGLMAINDSVLIECSLYCILQKYFKGKECYNNLVETCQLATFKGVVGQYLDVYTSKKFNLDQFTMKRYDSIADYKSSHLSFQFPTTLAMYFAGIKDPEIFKQSKTILFKFGHLYQVQDDCLGDLEDFEVLRKNSTDIGEGKCTWPIVKALELVTPEQRKILEECFGVSDPEKVRRVKQLYNDLDMRNVYFKYEEETYKAMSALIKKISCGNIQRFLMDLLEKIYRRQTCYI